MSTVELDTKIPIAFLSCRSANRLLLVSINIALLAEGGGCPLSRL